MVFRRILLFAALLLVVAAIANAIAPGDDPPQAVKGAPGATPPPADGEVVDARLPSRRDVQARVGDLVQLEVRHRASDVAQIVSLGIAEPVDPELPAEIVFDADRTGRFSVTLRDAARRVGVVEVLPER
jgi:hypothetical protein